MAGPYAEFAFDARIDGAATRVSCGVLPVGSVVCNFSVGRRAYEFRLTKCSGGGAYAFLSRFVQVYPDRETYGGFVRLDPDDVDLCIQQTPAQKLRMLERMARDVIACLSDIVGRHGREIVNYAIWYRENVRDDDTYSWLVCYMACCGIIHCNYMAGTVTYDRVGFVPADHDVVAAAAKGARVITRGT